MKIRTLLQTIMAATLGGVILLAAGLVDLDRNLDDSRKLRQHAYEVLRGVAQLYVLSQDYLEAPGARPLVQWGLKYRSIQAAAAELSRREALADDASRIQRELAGADQTFTELARIRSRSDMSKADPALSRQQMLANRLSIQLQNVLTRSSQMREGLNERETKSRRAALARAFAMLACMLLLVAGSAYLVRRRLSVPVALLREGAAQIGAGNLDHRIDLATDDEIGELSRDIDRMAQRLKEITASRDDLERETADREQAEAELRTQLQWNRAITETAPDAIFVTDREGRVVYANREAEFVYGYHRDELLGNPLHDLIHHHYPDGRPFPRAACQIDRALNQGKSIRDLEDVFFRKDGTMVSVSCASASLVLDGELIGAMTFARDISERKRSEARVRESEERFRSIFEQAAVGIALVAADYRWLRVNDKLCDLLGYRRQELLSGSLMDVLHPDDVAASRTHHENLARRGGSFTQERRYVRKDGKIIWARVTVSAAGDPNNPGQHYNIDVVEDITERRQAEDSLRRSEARYRESLAKTKLALLAARSGSFEWNIVTGELIWSEELERLYGMRPGEFGGVFESWATCVLPEDLPHTLAWMREEAMQENSEPDQFRIRRRDNGEVRWIEARGLLFHDAEQRPVRMVGINTDITERKQAEEERERLVQELRESGSRFQALADNIAQLAWMADDHGMIFWYNKRWFDYTGTTPEEMRGEGWHKIPHPDHLQRVIDKINHCFTTGEIWEDTFPMRGADGDYRWFLSRAIPIRDEQGRVLRWCGTNTDVTERLQVEAEIRELNTELENRVRERTAKLAAANKELESFSYSVSHDLRVPLRAVTGFAQILEEDYAADLDDEARRVIKVITDNTRRMQQLIDDLLAFSRLARKPIAAVPVDMDELAREALDELLAQTAHPVQCAVPPLPPALGERSLLRQVWINLLSNAIKFSGENPEPRIELGGSRQDGECLYFVKDNGVGFDMQYYDKLFGVFQRLHGQEEFPGTGVGLAIVQRLVVRHGGRVWAESEMGKGATFFFTLPTAEAAGDLAETGVPKAAA